MRRLGYALWLIAMGGLYLFENNAATRAVLVASVLIPAVNIVLVRLFSKAITLSVAAPDGTAKGETVEIVVSAGKLPVFVSLRAAVSCRNRLTGEETVLTGGGAVPLRFFMNAQNCGLIEIGCTARAGDLFGLYERSLTAEKAFVLIRPEILPMQIDLPAEDVSCGENLRRTDARRMGETVAVREYRAGDPVKMIHWKLSGKTDELMIRETGENVSAGAAVVFDASAFARPEIISRGAELFFSVSAALLENGTTHELIWRGEKGTVSHRIDSPEDQKVCREAFFAAELNKEAAPERVWADDTLAIRVGGEENGRDIVYSVENIEKQ